MNQNMIDNFYYFKLSQHNYYDASARRPWVASWCEEFLLLLLLPNWIDANKNIYSLCAHVLVGCGIPCTLARDMFHQQHHTSWWCVMRDMCTEEKLNLDIWLVLCSASTILVLCWQLVWGLRGRRTAGAGGGSNCLGGWESKLLWM